MERVVGVVSNFVGSSCSSGAEITLGDDEVDNDNADPYTCDLNAYATCVAAVSCESVMQDNCPCS